VTDIARLGIQVDTNAAKARDDLKGLAAASKDAERAASGTSSAFQAAANSGSQFARAAQSSVQANDRLTTSLRGQRAALQNLSFQINDIATSLASGSSPFQVLAQQGGQVMQVWQQSPGVFGQAATAVGRFMLSTKGAAATVAGLTIGGVALYERWAGAQRELSRALQGTGRDAGATTALLNAAAEAAARAQGVSVAQARGTVGALANTGRVGAGMLSPIASMQRDLAATLGIPGADANKLLAESFADPIRGAEMLNQRLGGLTERTRLYIAELVASGKEQRAQQVLMDTFAPRLGKASELTSIWARAWETLGAKAGNAGDAIGRAIERGLAQASGPSFADQAAQRLEQLQAQAQGLVVDRATGRELGNRSAFGPLQEDIQKENDARKRVSAELEIQRAAMHAIRVAQDTINLAVERQAGMEAEIARQRRSIDRGTEAARSLGVPERQQVDQVTNLADAYRRLYKAKEDAYQRQGDEGGNEAYQRARSEMMTAQRALRDQLQENGRGVFARDGALLLDNNQLLERRISLQDQVNQRATVERQQITAVTAQQQQQAAAAQVIQQAREQGASAGSAELVAAKALAAAETVRVGISHQLLQAARERIRSTQMQIDAERASAAVMGGSIAVQERVRLETQLINDARREYARLGLQMPQAEIEHYRRLAEEMGRVRQEQALMRATRDASFDRQTMFMGDGERNIANQLRGIYGDGWQSQMNSALASQLRFNDQLRATADLMSGFGSGMVSDLRSGVGLWGALGNQVARVGDRLMAMALDSALRSLLGSLLGGGGGGGVFGSLLGGLFGGGGGTISPFGQYATGGAVSGPGTGTSDSILARLSHGEFVVNAKQTAIHRPLLEAINSGVRGFAGGGMVRPSYPGVHCGELVLP